MFINVTCLEAVYVTMISECPFAMKLTTKTGIIVSLENM